jgi:DNA-binding response OmpR family regulator
MLRLSILIAEDEPDIREFLSIALQINGFNVITARNGEEAVALTSSHRPDLVLLDVRMPKVSGYQACETLKRSSDTREIPVVFLSAFANKDEVQQGLALGAEAYLTKPIAPDILVQRVNEVLQQIKTRGSRVMSRAVA